jgi:hypothetical protein
MKKITMLGTIALLALGFATCASAEIFSFTGTLSDSSTVTGAFSIDPVGGTILAVDLFVADDPTDTYNQIFGQTTSTGYYLDIDTTAANPATLPALFLGLLNTNDPGTLLGYTGGGLEPGSFWETANSSELNFTSGTISPVVPEPRFGALLVIGLAGLGFLARRKLAAAQA